jgi:uncharacterized surface protein with fasciclin (FAS1) repeats
MRFIKNNFLKTLFLIVFSVALLSACTKSTSDNPPAANLDELINGKTELSVFAAALKKTKLDIFTQGGGPFTVFAPTNSALAAIGINSVSDLNSIDSNLLVQLLTYHIQAGSRTYVEIPLGPNAPMSTQGGFTQYASRVVGGSAYINGAQIISEDIKASNGTLYLINNVLIPAYNNALVTLSATSDNSLMYQAIIKTAISSTFTASPVTVLAIPNSAMIAAGYDATTIAGLSGTSLTTLSNILKYHVIPQRIFSPDFKAGNLKTSQGTNLAVAVNGAVVTVKGTNNTAATPLLPFNFNVTNGVIQGVTTVLKP